MQMQNKETELFITSCRMPRLITAKQIIYFDFGHNLLWNWEQRKQTDEQQMFYFVHLCILIERTNWHKLIGSDSPKNRFE